jgi:hypothetical protein
MHQMTATTFDHVKKQWFDTCLCLQELILTQNRTKIEEQPIRVIVDFAWDHRNNAENGVLTIVNAESNDIIFSQVVQRCPLDPDIYDITICIEGYHGSSKGMESATAQEAFK